MAISSHTDPERGIRYRVVTGALEGREALNVVQGVLGASDPAASLDEIWDLRGLPAEHPPLRVDHLKDFIGTHGRAWVETTTARVAIIVTRTIDYGMGRMGQALIENMAGDRVMVFRSSKAAHRWLEDGDSTWDSWGFSPVAHPSEKDDSRTA